MTTTSSTNRKHKDGLFRMLFSDKVEQLSLYNALNATFYSDPEEITITTIEDVVFISHKNDASFVINNQLSIYEHQSSYCGNMPLRNLIYAGKQYAKLVSGKSLYSSKKIELDNPHFVVFYNGQTKKPEREVVKLSEAYKHQNQEVNLELKVLMLNINHGYNVQLMDKCPLLGEYARYVEVSRKYQADETLDKDTAIRMAVEECINNDILAKFLRGHREEVEAVCIEEYNQENHMESVFDDGVELGIEQTITIIKMHNAGVPTEEIAEKLDLALSYVESIIARSI